MRRDPELSTMPVLISTSAPERAPAGVPVLAKPIDIDLLCDCGTFAPPTSGRGSHVTLGRYFSGRRADRCVPRVRRNCRRSRWICEDPIFRLSRRCRRVACAWAAGCLMSRGTTDRKDTMDAVDMLKKQHREVE